MKAAADVVQEVLVATDAVRVETVASSNVGAGCELREARSLERESC